MTSLFDLNENSSDSEEDADYIPEGNVSDVSISDDDASNDEEFPQNSKTSRKSGKKQKPAVDNNVKTSNETDTSGITKEKANDIWKSFLVEVEESNPNKKENNCETSSTTIESEEKSFVKQNTQKQTTCDQLKSNSDILEFAGEPVSVSEDVSVLNTLSSDKEDSNEKTDLTTSNLTNLPMKRKGLQSVLGTITSKKQKINTLQKSLLDWKIYKKDEGIEEELQNFNRGKGGYIERQRFLERSNVRSYEIERDIRLSKIKK